MRHRTGHDVNYDIINPILGFHRQIVAAVQAQNFCCEPCGAFVCIVEAMRCRQAVQQGGGLFVNGTVIAMVGSADGAEDTVEIADAAQPAKSLQRLFVGFQNIAQIDPVVRLTDWPIASGRPCFC